MDFVEVEIVTFSLAGAGNMFVIYSFNRICSHWLGMRSLKYVKMYVGLWLCCWKFEWTAYFLI